MARSDRHLKQWHFSDSGSRFQPKRRSGSSFDPNPISATFTRKIIYCKRCGSRVVSNVSHCPYCGKNLLPVYRRLVFWIVIVILIGAGAVALIILTPSGEKDDARGEVAPPLVVGAPEDASIKDLSLGTMVDCDNLIVSVIESSQDLTALDGSPITTVKVQFLNKGDSDATVYSMQWQLETDEGTRVDGYIGKTSDGESIKGNLESKTLQKDASYTATLHFAATGPAKIVFTPDALSYTEQRLVTWLLPQAPIEEPTEEAAVTE